MMIITSSGAVYLKNALELKSHRIVITNISAKILIEIEKIRSDTDTKNSAMEAR